MFRLGARRFTAGLARRQMSSRTATATRVLPRTYANFGFAAGVSVLAYAAFTAGSVVNNDEKKKPEAAAKAAEAADKANEVHLIDPTEIETPDVKPIETEDVAADAQKGAFDPETGEINWDCPCLGGMADGPCGEEFKEAFSCFVYSKEEPKGIDCIEKFQAMQQCFRKHPEVYSEELRAEDPLDTAEPKAESETEPKAETKVETKVETPTEAKTEKPKEATA